MLLSKPKPDARLCQGNGLPISTVLQQSTATPARRSSVALPATLPDSHHDRPGIRAWDFGTGTPDSLVALGLPKLRVTQLPTVPPQSRRTVRCCNRTVTRKETPNARYTHLAEQQHRACRVCGYQAGSSRGLTRGSTTPNMFLRWLRTSHSRNGTIARLPRF